MESISTEIFVLLIATAGIAGFIDAISGGGGLLALPMLLWAGIPPVEALATNKLQGSFGTLTATVNYAHKGHLPLQELWPAVFLTLVGSVSGTILVQQLPSDFLNDMIPLLLIAFALYFLFSPRIGDSASTQRLGLLSFAATAGFTLGFYDGFFGPGTGSFMTAAFVILLGWPITGAVAGTKLLNFTSNISSLAVFAMSGHVIWLLGLAMGMAQVAGAWLGSHLAIRHGARIIRPVLVIISLAISLKLLFT